MTSRRSDHRARAARGLTGLQALLLAALVACGAPGSAPAPPPHPVEPAPPSSVRAPVSAAPPPPAPQPSVGATASAAPPATASAPPPSSAAPRSTSTAALPRASYAIDGRAVDEPTYAAFVARLRQVPGTWSCAETSDGGETTYRGTDAAGSVWVVTVNSSSVTGSRSTATRAR